MHFNEKAVIDPEQVGRSKIVEYLVGWSFLDAAGKSVPVSDAAIDNLDAETYSEVTKAIDAHENEIEAAIAVRKNDRAGAIKSSAT